MLEKVDYYCEPCQEELCIFMLPFQGDVVRIKKQQRLAAMNGSP